jgi:phosphotriesterase-related protein
VEVTSIGIRRDPVGLREISLRSGVHIVAGCGWYIGPSHPGYLQDASIADLTRILLADLGVGMDNTDVRAGAIGELGTSGPLTPNEEKVLRAASRAHHSTGVAISVHLSSWRAGTEIPKILRVFREEHVDPGRVVLGHMCMNIDADIRRAAAGEGFNIEFDTFGYENYYMWHEGSYTNMWQDPRDVDRVEFILDLVERGHLKQVVVAQDIYTKHNLKRYGGWGYDHILVNVVPMMKARGLSSDAIRQILLENPARILAS